MKFLGWMHRKFRQNSTEPFKDLVIGQTALDEENHHIPKAISFGNRQGKQTHQKDQQQNLRLRRSGEEEELFNDLEDQSSNENEDLFHGFLAIGTLGSDPSTTPTFGISIGIGVSMENITEKEDEVTENELKLINEELEKVLLQGQGGGADDGSMVSSGRNSHVSTATAGRSSHGSCTISTLMSISGKEGTAVTESAANANGNNATAVCPLQGYLFGSAIELSETTTVQVQAQAQAQTQTQTQAVAPRKEHHRTSLGELFQRTKFVDDHNSAAAGPPKSSEKEPSSAIYLMKKKLKKTILHASTPRTVDSASAETKLHKILHMFHRKVHPENSTAAQKCEKYQKNESKKKRVSSDTVHPEEDILIHIHPKRALTKEYTRQYKNQSNPPQFALGSEDSFENTNKEHWIKTDADYFVLEL